MKKAIVRIGILYCILLFTSTANAYWWRFSNFSTKTLLLKLKLLASNNPYYAIVRPNSSAFFDWSMPNPMAGFCFQKIEWAQVPPLLLENRDLVGENDTILDNKKMDTFLHEHAIVLKKASMSYFTSEIYKKTVQYAQALAPKKLVRWFAKQHAKSVCKSRHIAIIEDDKGNLFFFTQKS